MFKFRPLKNTLYTNIHIHTHTHTVVWWRTECRTSLDFLIATVINRSDYSIMLHRNLNAKRVTDATIGRPSLVRRFPDAGEENFIPFRGDANSR